jgi:hypothetical protein
MAHSTMVLHVATIPIENVTPSQAPIGTPLRPNPSVPLGYRALNPSITKTTQVTLEVLSLHLCLEELVLVALIWLQPPVIHFLVSKSLWALNLMLGGNLHLEVKLKWGQKISLGGNLRLESLTYHMGRM